jgi:hypothetical protein
MPDFKKGIPLKINGIHLVLSISLTGLKFANHCGLPLVLSQRGHAIGGVTFHTTGG